MLEHERIILATDIAGKEEADVEDFFEPGLFVELVNKTYGLSWEHTLTVEKLMDADQGTQRLVKKVEAYFRLLPQQTPEYSHYDPALYLLRTLTFSKEIATPMQKRWAALRRRSAVSPNSSEGYRITAMAEG